MNFRSLSFRPALIAAAAFTALAFASAPAVAQYSSNCSGCTTNPTPTPVANIGLVMESGAATLGNLSGNFTGVGNITGLSVGTSDLRSTLNAATNGCPGGCGDLSAAFAGLVTQQTGVQGVVQGNNSGPVNLTTGTVSATLLNFSIKRP